MHSWLFFMVLWSWAILLCGGMAVHAEEPTSRITVAVLPFEDQTKDPKAAHWRHSLPRMIGGPMDATKRVRLCASDAADYGLRRCQINAGEAINAEQAKTIGEIIEARRVVWGQYRREGKKWSATVQVMVVAGGEVFPPITATSADWFTLSQELAGKILDALKISLTEEQREKMKVRATDSAEALEYYSRCYAMQSEQRPFAEVGEIVQRAIKADPKFASAHFAYGACLLSQGKFKEGRDSLENALALQPTFDRALMALGVLSGIENDYEAAMKFLRDAARHGPDEPDNFIRLAELHMMMRENDVAVVQLEIALRLNPVSASAHAQLGYCYALMAKKDQAVRALQTAVLIDPIDAGVCQILAQGYDRLGMTSQAIEFREKLLASAKKIGISPEMLKAHEKRLQELRTTLKVTYVTAPEPRPYTDEQLRNELRAHLTPEEFSQLLYPLECTPAMKQWAQELTKDASDEMAKARILYDALAQHLSPAAGGARTAAQVYENWNTPAVSFQCQEYARLYVALARAVGLKAYFTRVDRDPQDHVVLHACAALFLNGKVLLVDVTFRWFGAPHKKFSVNNDYETMVMQMNQSDGLAYKRIAVKLQPDDLSLFNLGGRLMGENFTEEAKTVMEQFLQIKSEAWMQHYARGFLAGMEKNWDLSEKELRQATEIYADESSTHYHLGQVLMQKQDLVAAQDAFRSCIRYRPSRAMEEKCRRLIALIHEKLAGSAPVTTPLEAWRQALLQETHRAFPFFEWTPRIYPGHGLIYDERAETLTAAIEALRLQAEKEPKNAVCRYQRGFFLQLAQQPKESQTAMEEAQRIARSILKDRPDDIDACYVLVRCLSGNEEAGRIAKMGMEANPTDWRSWRTQSYYQSDVFLRALFQGLKDLPPQGYDLERVQEAFQMLSGSKAECVKLIQLLQESLASAEKAVAVSEESSDALLFLLAMRTHIAIYLPILGDMLGQEEDDMFAVSHKNLEVMRRIIPAAQDQPEVLAAISFIQFHAMAGMAREKQGPAYDATAMYKNGQAAIAPAMQRLQQLAESADATTAAQAYEGYAAVLLAQTGAGFAMVLPDDFAQRLGKALAVAPQRLLLWDMSIVHEANRENVSRAQIMRCHEMALKRGKIFPSARCNAILAATAPTPAEECQYWDKASAMEPTQLFYALHQVAAKMRVDASEAGLDYALTRLQEIGDQGYEKNYWQGHPEHNSYRLCLFVIQQALAGKMDAARRALDAFLRMSPSDPTGLKLSDLLENKPE
jgi:tetratricopeptide (TPR) repeat protein